MDHVHVFWQRMDALVETYPLVIDRPAGSIHPRFLDFQYPLDYGYLDGTQAMDGGGIDAWVGSLPERKLTALIITVDGLKHDTEMKLLIGCSAEEVEIILDIHNDGSQSGIVIRRTGA